MLRSRFRRVQPRDVGITRWLLPASICASAAFAFAALVEAWVGPVPTLVSSGLQQAALPQPPRDTLSRGLLLRAGLWPALGHPLVACAEARRSDVKDKAVTLNNGMPFLKASFGLQVYDDETALRLTQTAIEVGFRNFFASVLAQNQKGFARGVAASGIPRDQLFICGSVLSDSARGFENAYRVTRQGCEDNLKAFAVGGITYVDMIMLDYPAGDCESIRGQWKAFEEMLADGKTRSLAVSNFSPEQLDCILTNKSATIPTVNQLPYSVGNFDPAAVAENGKRGVIVQAWSPLSSGRLPRQVRTACKEVGAKYNKTEAQVALRWIVQTGATFSTQSRKREHFVEDLDIFDFELTLAEMDRLSGMNLRQ